jgi:hypothetical protein
MRKAVTIEFSQFKEGYRFLIGKEKKTRKTLMQIKRMHPIIPNILTA